MNASVEASFWICTSAFWHPGPHRRPVPRRAAGGRDQHGRVDGATANPVDRGRVRQPLPASADVVVVGAGIVGLATARAVQRALPDASVLVLDKEPRVAAHQSGHNSGVVHAGLYYAPGTDKAELCRTGRAELLDWCDRHGVTWRRCGKVVVASDADELPRLDALEERARLNGIAVRRLDPRAARRDRAARRGRGRAARAVDGGGRLPGGVRRAGPRHRAPRGHHPPRLPGDGRRAAGDRAGRRQTRGASCGPCGWRTAPACRATGWPRTPAIDPGPRSSPSAASTTSSCPAAGIWCGRSSTRYPTRASRSSASTSRGPSTDRSTPGPTRCWPCRARATAGATSARATWLGSRPIAPPGAWPGGTGAPAGPR